MMEQFRWYYNSVLTVVYNHHLKDLDNKTDENLPPATRIRNILVKQKKFSNTRIRDLFMNYQYVEETIGNLNFQDFRHNPDLKKMSIPPWWQSPELQPHNRLPRGAIDKFVFGLNSCISNFRHRNIKDFSMNYLTKKKATSLLHFEDGGFPSFIRTDIKSRYWYRTRDRKRKPISLEDIYKTTSKRSIEIVYEKDTKKYFLFCPVEVGWYPDDDLRLDSQETLFKSESRIISLDPGVRKFLVGYDPDGKTVFIGENSNAKLIQLLHSIDNIKISKKRRILWKKVKNLVEEMHWKSISFLIQNYDTIILPDFRVSQMIRSRKLTRMTKRLMCMYSFHQFRQRLEYKCSVYGKRLLIVDESYTSCTCGVCGSINRSLKGSERFTCECGFDVDRDVNGSRNILIKTLSDFK
jgi:IS605 OrfB family transposase